ncbi:putative cupredoxin, multicopper oxidase, type 3 [Helianthus annuus]|nr:putative cupredoxin, multicopper oxidase, type 3 [Helianthus annuus]
MALLIFVLILMANSISGEDPYRFFNWNVTYGDIYPLGGILINGQFPGPQIDAVTNDNVIVSVYNSLDEPFLITWLVLI